ncbi:MAG: hypoxanthine phosphoribosyltransferase [Armatimonadota bacterium]
MHPDIADILFSKDDIKLRIAMMGRQISADYKDVSLLLVGILKGSAIFLADILREIDADVNYDFVSISSYCGDTSSSGIVRVIKDVDADISGKHVLIVEDIVDTGWTLRLSYLKENLLTRGAESVKVCALLDKPSRRKVEVNIDYIGFVIDDLFVVGYGLDYDGRYRNLPYIGVLKPEVYNRNN